MENQPLNCKDLLTIINRYQQVLIYGTGWIAKDLYRYLNSTESNLIINGFISTTRKIRQEEIYGVKVLGMEDAKKLSETSVVIIAAPIAIQSMRVRKLKQEGFHNLVSLTDSLLNELSVLLKYIPLLSLRLEVQLVEHCNLGCKGCDHFSPLAKEQYVSYESLERDFRRISELTSGKVERIQLLGGEPLLHPQITEILSMTRQIFPKLLLLIVTNGIKLLDMSEAFWKCCHENNIQIGVTKYPITLDYGKMEARAAEYGVQYYYFDGEMEEKTLWKIKLDETGSQNEAENFQRCWRINRCFMLSEGRIYPCVIPPNIRHLNSYFNKNFSISDQDSIDIYEAQTIEDIFNFLCKPFPFCKYCDVSGETTGHPWQLSSRELSEWT